jgi:hypothetical protein
MLGQKEREEGLGRKVCCFTFFCPTIFLPNLPPCLLQHLRHYCQVEFKKVAYEVVHHAFKVHD